MSAYLFKKYGTPIDAFLSQFISELQTNRFGHDNLSLPDLGYFYYYLNAGLEWFKTNETKNPDLRDKYISVCNEEMKTLKGIYRGKDPAGDITHWGEPKNGGRTRKRSKRRGRDTLRPSKSRSKSRARGKSRKRTR